VNTEKQSTKDLKANVTHISKIAIIDKKASSAVLMDPKHMTLISCRIITGKKATMEFNPAFGKFWRVWNKDQFHCSEDLLGKE
jgi:hypothetical protein